MKRRSFVLTTLLIFLMLTMSAQAVEERAITAIPSLTFSGTTANCFADCKGGNSSDKVNITITLYQGTTFIKSWSGSGVGRLYISGDCKVEKGKTYDLVLEYSINGVEKPSITVTNTCK